MSSANIIKTIFPLSLLIVCGCAGSPKLRTVHFPPFHDVHDTGRKPTLVVIGGSLDLLLHSDIQWVPVAVIYGSSEDSHHSVDREVEKVAGSISADVLYLVSRRNYFEHDSAYYDPFDWKRVPKSNEVFSSQYLAIRSLSTLDYESLPDSLRLSLTAWTEKYFICKEDQSTDDCDLGTLIQDLIDRFGQ